MAGPFNIPEMSLVTPLVSSNIANTTPCSSLARTGERPFGSLTRKEQEQVVADDAILYERERLTTLQTYAAKYGKKLNWVKERFENDTRIKDRREVSAWNAFLHALAQEEDMRTNGTFEVVVFVLDLS